METKPEYAIEVSNQVQLGSLALANNQSIINRATELSKELSKLIDDRKLFNNISGRKYVRVDGWATLGAMLGVLPREVSVDESETGDFEAVVELIRASDGAVIGRGSAIVGADEKTWASRPRYARRSMAITRATGKAYRLGFSWIMTLAGYEPTPAEEMDGIIEGEIVQSPSTNHVHENKSMSLEDAMKVESDAGVKYGDMTDADLEGRKIGITKALNGGKLNSKQQDEALKKLMAANMILASRTQSATTTA